MAPRSTSGWLAVALAACGGGDDAAAVDAAGDAAGGFVPGPAQVLSIDSPGDDEDPALLRARDGSIYAAWFSHGAGDDILISRTVDGARWTPAVHVSRGAAIDFGPTLAQDAGGFVHVAWFRWMGAPPGRVVHARAPAADDGLGWDAAREVDVTRAAGTDDWVPSLAIDGAGALVIAMARNTCPPPATCHGIAVTRSLDGGDRWSPAELAVPATATVEHHLPALARDGDQLVMVWTPYDRGAGPPWQGTGTGAHLAVVRSPDGVAWSAPADVTARADDAITLFPTLYADHAGGTELAWMTADAGGSTVVSRPLADPAVAPAALPVDGYSPRVVATPTPGVYLAAWVAGPAGERDVFVRVFAR